MLSLRVIGVLTVLVCSLHSGRPKKVNTIEEMLVATVEGYDPVDLQQMLDDTEDISINTCRHISFWLYTKAHNDTGLKLVAGDAGTLASSDFDDRKPTKILVHGWLGDVVDMESVCSLLKTEYLESDSYNVVCVDWTVIAMDIPYITARLRCKEIGNCVADFISMLFNNSTQTVDDIHIIGFSMGAHIAGYAGKRFKGQLQRITGLDPAKPLFFSRMPNERLNENDAIFVDIVHTSSFLLGEHKPIGKIDFYPNGGYTKQPGCKVFGEVCSHYKSYEYYARSIRSKEDNSFKAVRCEQWEDYKKSRCDDYDDFTYMGEYASSNFSGNYYLSIS